MTKEWIKTVKTEVPLNTMLEGCWKNINFSGYTKRAFVAKSTYDYVESDDWYLERTSEINYRECSQFIWPDYWRVQQDVPDES